MLVLPAHFALNELPRSGPLHWWRWGLGDFRDQVRRTGLRDPVDEHAQQRDLHHDGEGGGEAEEHATAVNEPDPFLLLVEPDAVEVRFQ